MPFNFSFLGIYIDKISLGLVSRLNSSHPLSLSSYMSVLQHLNHGPLLDSLQFVHFSCTGESRSGLRIPGVSQQCWAEDRLPWALGSALPNAAQNAFGIHLLWGLTVGSWSTWCSPRSPGPFPWKISDSWQQLVLVSHEMGAWLEMSSQSSSAASSDFS